MASVGVRLARDSMDWEMVTSETLWSRIDKEGLRWPRFFTMVTSSQSEV